MSPDPADPRRTSDDEWNREQRAETTTERLDRNWAALLQELRVVQTGVQILTGFLLTLPFQNRFEDLDEPLRVTYLVTVSFAMAAAVLLAAPVALHRALFRQHRLDVIVTSAHRLAYIGLILLGLALAGAVVVVFGATAGMIAGFVAGACMLVAFLGCWLVFPFTLRLRAEASDTDADREPDGSHR
ncbi:DUF6328 family protein [Gordonia sp. DT219]|uniref:DUF6328 family protein n=1 Tax=Gordonia sp. DT219 TaxID=3416658 RepID=UPI003CE76AA1